MKPFEQFEIILIIKDIFINLDISITNAWIILLIVMFTIMLIKKLIIKKTIISSKELNLSCKAIFNSLQRIITEQIGKNNKGYIGLILTMFTIILVINLLGLIPFSYALTGQLSTTLILSNGIFIGIIIIGVINLKNKFLNIFIPKEIDVKLIPLMVIIEVLSFLIRPISLAIRLFANIMAGHILLYIISGVVLLSLDMSNYIIIASNILDLLVMLETGIALLQAYVFLILLCIYFKDLTEHH